MLLFLVLLLCTFWELCALIFNILLFTDKKKKKVKGCTSNRMKFFHKKKDVHEQNEAGGIKSPHGWNLGHDMMEWLSPHMRNQQWDKMWKLNGYLPVLPPELAGSLACSNQIC